MRQTKKILSLLVIICIVISLFPTIGTANASTSTHRLADDGDLRALLTSSQVKNGDTIVLEGSGFVNDTRSNSEPWVIDKSVTISGGSINLRAGGIILGANVTFDNVVLGFANRVRNVIMANGHTLTLNNVTQERGTRQVHLLTGGVTGITTTAKMGTHGKIVIQGNTSLGNMYAGSISADGGTNVWNLPSTISIDRAATGKMGDLYASGALQTPVSDNFFDKEEPVPPTPSADHFRVTGKVEFELYNNVVIKTSGSTGAATDATVTYYGGPNPNVGLTFEDLSSLTVAGGKLAPSKNSSFAPNASLSVKPGAQLDIAKYGEDVTINNFEGGGILALDQNQIFNITGNVNNTTTIGIGDMLSGQSKNPVRSHPYIRAANSTDNSFVLAPLETQASMQLVRSDSGEWSATDGSPRPTPQIKQIPVPTANTNLKWTGTEQIGVSEGIGYTVTGNKQTAVGSYTAKAVLQSGYQWNDNTSVEKTIDWSIGKAVGPGAPLGLQGIAPTSQSNNDGSITGTNNKMEYSTDSNFNSKIEATDNTIIGLAPNTYYVRFKETATHEPSQYTTITVPAYNAPHVVSVAMYSTDHKTAYTVGDPLDVSNLVIEVTMSDNSKNKVNVTDNMVSGFNSSKAVDTQTLTISYQGKVTTYTVSIVAPVAPPVDPPVAPPVSPPADPPVAPPVSPPADPPVSPPVTPPVVNKYAVTVQDSYAAVSGAGDYTVGDAVYLKAGDRSGHTFNGWTVSGIILSNPNSANTDFIMPANAVSVTATWNPINAGGGGGGFAGGGGYFGGFAGGGSSTPVEEPTDDNETDPPVPDKDPESVTDSITFKDVENHWAADAIAFVTSRNLLVGTTADTFSPNMVTNRGMMFVLLARLAGHDTTTNPSEAWYVPGMKWAIEKGISDGTNPESNVTREQFATMLWRYAGSPVSETGIGQFNDHSQASDYALVAMSWAVENGIMKGKGEGILDPKGSATRAETAQMLMNFMNKE